MSERMRAAVWTGPERIEIAEVDRPALEPGRVLIAVAYAGICGTDLMIYLGKHGRAQAPLVMSHEFVGTVAAGDAFAPGTPVTVNPLLSCGRCHACRAGLRHVCARLGLVGIDADGGFAEYVSVPAGMVRPLPEGLDLAKAALIEPLAVAVHALRASSLRVGNVTAVLGAGPVGLLTAQIARLAGARRVLVSERSPRRLALARALGFEVLDAAREPVADAILAATDGEGVPVVFETAGVQPTIDDACRVARIAGEILQVGMPKQPPTVDLTALLFREVRIVPIRVYRDEDFDAAIALAGDGRVDLKAPVTHTLPLASLAEALELARSADDACKILLTPRG